MSQRVFSFLVVWFTFFSGEIFAQKNLQKIPVLLPVASFPHVVAANPSPAFPGIGDSYLFKRKTMLPGSLFPLPPNAYASHLPFFCRQELKMEKSLSFPVRLRVGNIDYVDYLEKKPNSFLRR